MKSLSLIAVSSSSMILFIVSVLIFLDNYNCFATQYGYERPHAVNDVNYNQPNGKRIFNSRKNSVLFFAHLKKSLNINHWLIKLKEENS
jgi:hypothetical protein